MSRLIKCTAKNSGNYGPNNFESAMLSSLILSLFLTMQVRISEMHNCTWRSKVCEVSLRFGAVAVAVCQMIMINTIIVVIINIINTIIIVIINTIIIVIINTIIIVILLFKHQSI